LILSAGIPHQPLCVAVQDFAYYRVPLDIILKEPFAPVLIASIPAVRVEPIPLDRHVRFQFDHRRLGLDRPPVNRVPHRSPGRGHRPVIDVERTGQPFLWSCHRFPPA
jgi:hypothetical protein